MSLLTTVHKKQIHRDPWPDFANCDLSHVDTETRREACRQWALRAWAEQGSVFQFSELMLSLTQLSLPLEFQGALARLISDEIRHVELCMETAKVCNPDQTCRYFNQPEPNSPWSNFDASYSQSDQLRWAGRAVLTACCLGETLSRPMLKALTVLSTEPLMEAVSRQILRDEELHANFGWVVLKAIMERMSQSDIEFLQQLLSYTLAAFERTTSHGISVEELSQTKITITRDRSKPHLGTLTPHQSAMMFYSTLEHEIFPKFEELGLDALKAWHQRHATA